MLTCLLLPTSPTQLRLAGLKREEEGLRQEEERLHAEKFRHLRVLKRLRDEDGSRFNNLPVLANRYQLTNLLGKGGFSEVYKVGRQGQDRVSARYENMFWQGRLTMQQPACAGRHQLANLHLIDKGCFR